METESLSDRQALAGLDVERFEMRPIGVVRTPYQDAAPYQPPRDGDGDFRILLQPGLAEGLGQLDSFKYIYVLAYLGRDRRTPSLSVTPPWTGGVTVGLFASRSPNRFNPIGLSVVELKRIEGHVLHTGPMDLFDRTRLLDIKPYIQDLDSKDDANHGWLTDMDGLDHLLLHIRGVPHEH